MLPDFMTQKRERFKNLNHGFTSESQRGTILSRIQTFRLHEGDRWTIFRDDGSQETMRLEKLETLIELSRKDIHENGEFAINNALYKSHKDLRKSQKQLLYRRLNEVTEAAGNTVDAQGGPITAETLLQCWETMDFSFDEKGNWCQPTMIFNPVQSQRVAEAFEQLETDPDLKSKLDDLIRRKREEWNVREANRKLVD